MDTYWFVIMVGQLTMRFKADADGVRWKLDCQVLISLLQKKIIIPAPFKRWVVILPVQK